jgi:hypothetical protein
MTMTRLVLPILAAALVGSVAHAGDFSLGGARLLAENSTQQAVDVTVTFTDRGHPLAESAEGGDSSSSHSHATRGADVATPDTSDDHPAPKAAPAPKTPDSSSSGADAPHGVSILPPSAIKRPSYRWQSLVPGTIK